MNIKRTTGFAHIMLLVVFLAIAIGVVGYYAIRQKGPDLTTDQTVQVPVPSISPSTDVNTIQQEFDATYVEPVDGEFSSISAQVKSL